MIRAFSHAVSALERVLRDGVDASPCIPGLLFATVQHLPAPDTCEVCRINAIPLVGESPSPVRVGDSRDMENLYPFGDWLKTVPRI